MTRTKPHVHDERASLDHMRATDGRKAAVSERKTGGLPDPGATEMEGAAPPDSLKGVGLRRGGFYSEVSMNLSMRLVGKSMLLALDARKRRMLYNSGPAR